MNTAVLIHCPLFQGIPPDRIETILKRLSAKTQHFEKNEYIFQAEDPAGSIGIVLTGEAHVLREDYWGNRSILTLITAGDMFGEAFACAGAAHLPVGVIAAGNTHILFIKYQKIITDCAPSCPYHNQLIQNMLQIIAQKNIMLTQKMEHIAKKSIREKLLSYLSFTAVQSGSDHVRIPFNRQELANYLNVDRSALSRELSRMQEEGLLQYKGCDFRLL